MIFTPRKFSYRFAARLSLPFTLLLWLVILLPYYQWMIFGQTGRRKVPALFATQFLLKHGWRELLSAGLAGLAMSLCFCPFTAFIWNWAFGLSKPAVIVEASSDALPGVWPPPPTVSADDLPTQNHAAGCSGSVNGTANQRGR